MLWSPTPSMVTSLMLVALIALMLNDPAGITNRSLI
jgi:hypothetical protein